MQKIRLFFALIVLCALPFACSNKNETITPATTTPSTQSTSARAANHDNLVKLLIANADFQEGLAIVNSINDQIVSYTNTLTAAQKTTILQNAANYTSESEFLVAVNYDEATFVSQKETALHKFETARLSHNDLSALDIEDYGDVLQEAIAKSSGDCLSIFIRAYFIITNRMNEGMIQKEDGLNIIRMKFLDYIHCIF